MIEIIDQEGIDALLDVLISKKAEDNEEKKKIPLMGAAVKKESNKESGKLLKELKEGIIKEYEKSILDNWKGRDTGMICKTCIYYVSKKDPIGRCRRHAPTMKGFPVVFETDWCGDHKLKE